MLERQEHADIARTGIDGAEEGDDQQWPERGDARETQPGGEHEQRSAEQQRLLGPAMTDGPDRQRRQRGTREGCRAEQSDVELPEAEREEVGGQQHRNVTVRECAQRAPDEKRKNGRIDA